MVCFCSAVGVVVWLLLFVKAYGADFVHWELSVNLWGRFSSGGLLGFEKFINGISYPDFYLQVIKDASLSVGFLSGLAVLAWLLEFFKKPRRNKFNYQRALLTPALFFGGWLLGMLAFFQQTINYITVLFPFFCVWWGWWLGLEKSKNQWIVFTVATVFSFLKLFWQPEGWIIFTVVLILAMAMIFFYVKDKFKPMVPVSKVAAVISVLVLFIGGLASINYWVSPPDPNRELVNLILKNPARFKGEILLVAAHPAEAQAVEYYSDYKTDVIENIPPEEPEQALLIKVDSGFRFHRK
jgi:hypothetical protein